jgi:ParB family chromosome partitioning protein
MAKQALPGRRGNHFFMRPEDLCVVGHDTADGPEHPLYDERVKHPLDDGMVRNIMFHGVLEPVLVRKDGDVPEVVAGRRRVLHAREANRRLHEQGHEEIEIPVIVRKGTDAAMAGIMISENEIRRDDGPLAKARKAQWLTERGRDLHEIAVYFGVTTQAVKGWLALMDCDDVVLQAVEDGELSATAAAQLATLPRKAQRETWRELAASEGKVTVAKASATAKAKSGGKDKGKPAKAPSLAPGKRKIAAVLAYAEETEALDAQAIGVLRWVLGQEEGSETRGLASVLLGIEEEKARKAEEKRARKKAPPKA